MNKSERIEAQQRRGVLTQHRDRMANDPEYRENALTAPSITDKTGISAKVLDRTTPTALSGAATAASSGFDVEAATKDELVEYAEANDIDVKKSAKVDEIRGQVRDAISG